MAGRPSKRATKVIQFIETYCVVPEGKLVGKPLRLLPFQKKFIRDIFAGGRRARRAMLSIARKNGKTALIAAIVLAFLVGPEAVQNSQVVSGARSREQAALVFKLATKMVQMSDTLRPLVKVTPSSKTLIGLPMNVEYRALAAEAGSSHGLSPLVAILDEVGQIRGPDDAFVEAIETAQGAYDDPLLIAISTQASADEDMFSIWLDDAIENPAPGVVCHLYTAPEDCDLDDREAWAAANPALGEFRSVAELEEWAEAAERMPSKESSFRWLYLNQRLEAHEPYVAPAVWKACGGDNHPEPVINSGPGALDLSSNQDLTSYTRLMREPGDGDISWTAECRFWLPKQGLRQRSRDDRVEYDKWLEEGHLEVTQGATVDYDEIAPHIISDFRSGRLTQLAFDRWSWRFFWSSLKRCGASEDEIGRDHSTVANADWKIIPFGQGYKSMSPALRALDELLLNGRVHHYDNPILTMCAKNAVVLSDPQGNRKLAKLTKRRRIDGMVTLAMAAALAAEERAETPGFADLAQALLGDAA